jgi:hypothetical protein
VASNLSSKTPRFKEPASEEEVMFDKWTVCWSRFLFEEQSAALHGVAKFDGPAN